MTNPSRRMNSQGRKVGSQKSRRNFSVVDPSNNLCTCGVRIGSGGLSLRGSYGRRLPNCTWGPLRRKGGSQESFLSVDKVVPFLLTVG